MKCQLLENNFSRQSINRQSTQIKQGYKRINLDKIRKMGFLWLILLLKWRKASKADGLPYTISEKQWFSGIPQLLW
jgi:hypothetical protein